MSPEGGGRRQPGKGRPPASGTGGGDAPGRPPRARKSLGQHFLSDPGILRRIVEGAGVAEGETVLEIGPGPGGLTRALLAAGARVWALEADPRMVEHLERAGLEGLRVWVADALEADYEALAGEAGGPLRVVANLPYNISGPLLARLLRQRRAFTSLTLMLQREVGERICAPPGTRQRGSLSVLAQCFCRVSLLLRVSPGSFRPPPKVESVVVRLDRRPEPAVGDEEALWTTVRSGFGQRRKMLRNSLRALAGEDLEAVLGQAGLTGRERPEALGVEDWVRLADAVASRGRGGQGRGG
ncbi:MAG: 16S rRNA (adenine(1518)-N(6)/adenine(1519)-N(6))-dimethyltransferase RsmA [Deferrisomatales bacterium]